MSSRFGRRPGRARLQLTSTAALLAVVALTAGCSSDDDSPLPGASGSSAPKANGPSASVHAPDGCTTVVNAGTPAELSVAVSQALFQSAPVVVVAPATDGTDLRAAAEQARRLGAPLLVTTTEATEAAALTNTPTSADPTSTPTLPPTAPAQTDNAETDSADCAEAAPSAVPTAVPTAGPTATATASPEATEESSAEATAEPSTGSTAEPTEGPTASATPIFTPAAFSVATADAQACSPSKAEPAATPTGSPTPTSTASPSATPTVSATPTASGTPSGTPSSTAGPTDSPSTTPTPVDAPLDTAVASEISRLTAKAVLVFGTGVAEDVRAALPDVKVVTSAGDLPATSTPAPLSGLTVLVGNDDDTRVGAIAAEATALAAGARAIGVEREDPRADACAIKELSTTPASAVLAAGDFGSAERLADRIAVVATGVELPGGGQLFFPGRRLVALYGYPGAPELGVLGAQGVSASIARAKDVAEMYDSISDVPVIPTFEVIVTVAQGVPGRDGDYSAESTVEAIRPYVEQAAAAGMYVVLDLQPGRSDFLSQAKRYAELLKLPNVGLALDPEWRLKPNQVHLRQIGSVDASEINRVSDWLADLTAEYRLPQKLLVLHQFSLTMITNRASLDTSHDELALLIHMDGQGQPIQKEGTWRIVTNTVPSTIWMGFKNFYKKDTRLMTPRETLDRKPVPVMISYQ